MLLVCARCHKTIALIAPLEKRNVDYSRPVWCFPYCAVNKKQLPPHVDKPHNGPPVDCRCGCNEVGGFTAVEGDKK